MVGDLIIFLLKIDLIAKEKQEIKVVGRIGVITLLNNVLNINELVITSSLTLRKEG